MRDIGHQKCYNNFLSIKSIDICLYSELSLNSESVFYKIVKKTQYVIQSIQEWTK